MPKKTPESFNYLSNNPDFAESEKMLRTDEGRGEVFTVTDEPATTPRGLKTASVTDSSFASANVKALFGALIAAGLLLASAAMFRRQPTSGAERKAVAKSAALRLD